MVDLEQTDRLVTTIPIRYSQSLSNLQVHQFPLLNRPLQTPPSAADSGKFIRARIKPQAERLEIHVPFDTRHDVWNKEKGKHLGSARTEDDRVKNQGGVKVKMQEGEETRLNEMRMSSEQIPQQATHMIGVVRDGCLHLHPVSGVHQFRPTLTYLDLLSTKSKRSMAGGDSDDDEGPPPDPDEPPPPPSTTKKEKKSQGEAKEVQLSAKKSEDKGAASQGGLTVARREMLAIIQAEEEEAWQDLDFNDVETEAAEDVLDSLFSKATEDLQCSSDVTQFLKGIQVL